MRLQIASDIDSRDGVSAKDERLTNMLSETDKDVTFTVVRPGLVLDAEASGVGNGLVVFNGELVSVYGANLTAGVEEQVAGFTSSYKNYNQSVQRIFPWASGFLLVSDDGTGGGYAKVEHTTDFITYATVIDSSSVFYIFNVDLVASNSTYWFMSIEDPDLEENYTLRVDVSLGITLIATSLFYGKIWDGAKFVGNISGDKTATSTDGETWVTGTTRGRDTYASEIAYNGSVYCLIGYSLDGKIWTYTSTDGLLWANETNVTTVASYYVVAITYGAGCFVIAGNNFAYRSTNGFTWSATNPFPGNVAIQQLTYNSASSLFIGVGYYELYADYRTIVTSPDGITWTSFLESFDGMSYKDLCSNGEGFVAVGYEFNAPYDGPHINIATYNDGLSTLLPIGTVTGTHFDFAQSPL
jgi:hypothetical protein